VLGGIAGVLVLAPAPCAPFTQLASPATPPSKAPPALPLLAPAPAHSRQWWASHAASRHPWLQYTSPQPQRHGTCSASGCAGRTAPAAMGSNTLLATSVHAVGGRSIHSSSWLGATPSNQHHCYCLATLHHAISAARCKGTLQGLWHLWLLKGPNTTLTG
jgi:hypothetical protein